MNASEWRIEFTSLGVASVVARRALVTPLDQNEAIPQALRRLVAAVAVQRDRQAFAVLFNHFAPRVKSYLLRFGASSGVAEEVAQETMLTLWRKAPSFDPDRGSVSAWIFTIARNLRIDRERQRANQTTFPYEIEVQAPSPDTSVMAMEREAQVRKALLALTEEQATVVRLSFFSDKPHAEIARELGIPLGTVKSRVRLALKRLRSLLGEAS